MPIEWNKTDIAIEAMSEIEKSLDIKIDELTKKLESLKAERSSIQEAKRILWASRGNTSISGSLQSKSTSIESASDRGTPEDWLFPQYKLLGSRKAIEQILEERKEPVEIEDLVKKLYDTKSEDDFKRARNSLSAGLRRGAEEGAWKKVGRSFYEANSVGATNGVAIRNTTTVLGLTQNQNGEPETEQPIAEYDSQQSVV